MSQPYLQPVEDAARFEAGAETVDNSTPTAPPPSGTGSTKRVAGKARTEKPLPTDRLSFGNQIKILRAVAATSGNNRRGSTAEAMSAAIDLSGNTGGLNSRFFRSANWFESVGRGEYTASAGVLAYNQHITIDPDAQHEATAMMRSEVETSWFWETLEPMLASGHPISIKLAVLELAKACGATNHTVQLETIIDWLVWVGLVVREADQIKACPSTAETDKVEEIETDAVDATGKVTIDHDKGEGDGKAAADPVIQAPAAAAATSDLDAIVSFNMSVRLTAADMKSLDQEQRDFVLALAERLRG